MPLVTARAAVIATGLEQRWYGRISATEPPNDLNGGFEVTPASIVRPVDHNRMHRRQKVYNAIKLSTAAALTRRHGAALSRPPPTAPTATPPAGWVTSDRHERGHEALLAAAWALGLLATGIAVASWRFARHE